MCTPTRKPRPSSETANSSVLPTGSRVTLTLVSGPPCLAAFCTASETQ